MKLRLFAGIPLDDALKGAIGKWKKGLSPEQASAIRFPRPDTLHITIHFIGEVEETLLEPIETVLVPVAGKHEPFPLFPQTVERAGNVLFLRMAYSPLFDRLSHEVRDAVSPLAPPPNGNKKQMPHVTVGRVRGSNRTVSFSGSLHAAPLAVHSFCLYRSHLLPDGPKYEILRTYTLTG